jgi:hypothetical protein
MPTPQCNFTRRIEAVKSLANPLRRQFTSTESVVRDVLESASGEPLARRSFPFADCKAIEDLTRLLDLVQRYPLIAGVSLSDVAGSEYH